jgi:ADP-dependent NAD(P)H-hydrate dehydratase / NAD(P)H-hydrate epimerase
MDQVQRLLTGGEMSELDRHTIENLGVSGHLLMENAGFACVRELYSDFLKSTRVAVLCGLGNNGGDGYVIARHLHLRGFPVVLFNKAPPRGQDARVHYEIAKKAGVEIRALDSFDPTEFDLGVDALFGTGLVRKIEGDFYKVISRLNQVPRILAVDIPSGVSSDTGEILGIAVRAFKTVTFQAPKRGHFLFPGSELRGSLLVQDIGISTERLPHQTPILETALEFKLPQRPMNAHKASFGHLLCLGGVRGKSGAIILAAKSALNSGAGLVTLASSSQTLEAALSVEPALMGFETSDPGSCTDDDSLRRVLAFKKNVVLAGPGGGLDLSHRVFFRDLIQQEESALVLDADALRCFESPKQTLDILGSRIFPTVLTPHLGEFAALTGIDIGSIEASKLDLARDFARQTGTVLVLKGAGTVVATPEGPVRLFYHPNSVLAKAGSGDVLAGVIAALICQGFSTEEAAINGVQLHSAAAQIMADKFSPFSGSPLKLIDAISESIQDQLRQAL